MNKRPEAAEELRPRLLEAREHFARGQLGKGLPALQVVMNLLVSEEDQTPLRQVFYEATIRLHEFGETRMEYLILAMVAMEVSLKRYL